MMEQFFSVAIIGLLGAMSPGPDFAIVTKNTLLHSRQSGYFTTLGIATAIVIHMTYCLLGLAIVISSSIFLFNLIKYAGAFYLVYLGIQSFLSTQSQPLFIAAHKSKHDLSHFTAFKQGFLCNLLNPKATLFFLSLFTVIIKPNTPFYWQVIYASELLLTSLFWFSLLSTLLSHGYIKKKLEQTEPLIAKLLGLFLIAFGIFLTFI